MRSDQAISLALALTLLGATTAFADMPPRKFDYTPKIHVVKHKVAYGQADALCKKIYKRRHGEVKHSYARFGCTIYGDGKPPEIVYSYDPTGADKDMANNVLRHEYGHVNGWNSAHSN